MNRLALWMAVMGLAFSLGGGQAWGDDFYVVAGGGGTSGKVLNIQVLTSNTQNLTLGTDEWAKLSSPQWIYTKLSATSDLVITYQDMLSRVGAADSLSMYQLRVNDQPSVAGSSAAVLNCNSSNTASYGATGVWSGVPKGVANLSIWHFQLGCTLCVQNSGIWTTNVLVMEIEK